MIIELKNLSKSYGNKQALKNISLELTPGTVSYTHLDVYKRQVLSRLRNTYRNYAGIGAWHYNR